MKYEIFVCHYTPLTERKKHMIEQFRDHDINNYQFIETYDKERLSIDDKSRFDKKILDSEISLFLKHMDIFSKDIDGIIVVLEDDAIFVDGFKEKLENYLKQLENLDWDIAFTGACCNLHASPLSKDQAFYESSVSRGTCMYILNKHVNSRLYFQFYAEEEIINKPIDHWLDHKHLIYLWSEPVLVDQGSEQGKFKFSVKKRFDFIRNFRTKR
jgi:GR25 family glycosyltransferase involved in LPS biosynthesis